MDSPWQLPIPIADDTTRRVVVYFYSDRWIPIPCFCLSEAIALYRKALVQGKQILVFPVGLNLETENILLTESHSLQGKLASRLARSYTSPKRELATASLVSAS